MAALVLSILSGLLAGLSFPKYGVSFIAWIAYIPLLFAIKIADGRKPVLKSYMYGFVSGFTTNIILLYWVVVAMNKYGNINLFVSIFALILLSAILSALYYGPFTALIKVFRNASISGELLFIPVVWVLLEYIRTYLLSGFPWELLGYSQYRNLALIQISRFTSVYGISFAIMLFNTLVYEIIIWWYDTKSVRTYKYPFLLAKTLIVLLLITGMLVYGDITVNATKKLAATAGKDINISLIQGNINQNHKWDIAYQNKTMQSYFSLTQQAVDHFPARLVIWPETAVPFFFQSNRRYASEVSDFTRSHKIYLLFGSLAYRYTNKGINYFNSAFLMTPDGSIKGQYDKRHLVPFGEYLPLKHIFFFLKKLTANIGNLTPGKKNNLLVFNNVKIGTLICYEIIFPQLSAEDARNGANLLVTITDDAWFGNTSAPYQHLSMSVFRAVEDERFVVRAANTGITAVISPTGKIISSTKLFVPAFINYKIKLINTKTFYTRYGDIFIYICIIVFGLFTAFYIYKRLTQTRI